MADHLPLQRSLCLLRHLQDGPQDRDTLASFVHIECDPTAYLDFSQKTYQKRFENDMTRLREWGVATDYYDGHYRPRPSTAISARRGGVATDYYDGHYRLLSYGDFSPVGLPDHALEMLAFLSETFAPGAPHHEAIQQLLRTITNWLPSQQRDSIPMRRQRLRLDLRRRDDDQVDLRVQNAIDRALSQHRLLRFAYRAPGQSDGEVRIIPCSPGRSTLILCGGISTWRHIG